MVGEDEGAHFEGCGWLVWVIFFFLGSVRVVERSSFTGDNVEDAILALIVRVCVILEEREDWGEFDILDV